MCPVCEEPSEKRRPRVRLHAEERPGGWQRVTQQEYGGISRLASGSMERMKLLYVLENGVNRAIGYICDQDHVVLDAPAPGLQHVLTQTLSAQVICLAAGEAVSSVDGSIH